MNERKRFTLLTSGVISTFLLVGVIVFWPLTNTLLSTRQKIQAMEKQLAKEGFESGVVPLQSREVSERQSQVAAKQDWGRVRERLNLFSAYYAENQNAKDVDYLSKVAQERVQLSVRAKVANLSMPYSLGLPDQVRSGDDATTLLMQLKVISTIVQIAAEERIGRIGTITPLPPTARALDSVTTPYLKEFPIRVECEGEMEPLLKFVHKAATHEQLLAVRNLRLEKIVPDEGAGQFVNEENPKLRAVIVLEALVVLKDPEQVEAIAPAAGKPKHMPAEGH